MSSNGSVTRGERCLNCVKFPRKLDVERKIENLENYQEIFEDREIKMIELKKEIDDLRKKY